MLAKTHRFLGKDALKPLFKRGQNQRSDGFSLRHLKTQHDHNRFAVIVSKKVNKRAVFRNRIRRRIYSCLEDYAESTPAHDVAIIVYDPELANIPSDELSQRLADTLDQVFD